jgi:hypothetical protein
LLHQVVVRAYVHRWLGLFIQFRLEDEEADKGFSLARVHFDDYVARRAPFCKPFIENCELGGAEGASIALAVGL